MGFSFVHLLIFLVLSQVFGVSLEDVLARDGRAPQFVFDLITFIGTEGLEEEGIFRVPGNMEALNNWKRKIDSNVAPNLVSEIGVHDAAGLLKLYFRELPGSFIPQPVFDELMKVSVCFVCFLF